MTGPARRVETLSEWAKVTLPGVRLGANDVRLARQLRDDRRLEVEELRDALRIRARSWIGVVSFEALELRIEPKLAGDRLDLLALIDFAAGVDALERTAGAIRFAAPDEHLLDLLARILGHHCARLVRRGLVTDYTPREEDLPVVRGRIDVAELMLRRMGRADRVPCRFDERLQDVPENQLLAVALRACERRVRHASVHRQLASILPVFEDVCDPAALDLTAGVPSIHYHRLNEHYRAAHDVARLVLEGTALRALDHTGRVESHAFLLDMNAIFERFVWRLCDRLAAGTGTRVHYQAASSSILRAEPGDRPYGRVIPDVLVERWTPEFDRIAIDAKYKRYDESKVDSADVYQAFLYAYAFSTGSTPRALLVHPASEGRLTRRRLRIQGAPGRPGAVIELVSLPVRETLRAVRTAEGDHGQLRADVSAALLG